MREDDEFSSSASDEGEEQPSSEQIEQYQPNGVISHMKEEGEDGKRRTKRKKKNKAAGPKPEAEQRFEAVVDQLKSQDAEGLWVSLGSCDIQDSSIGALTEALATNTTVTALDLSRNSITCEGAEALFGALGTGAASDLTELDLRGNPFSSEDLASLAHLWSARKQLNVLVGALKTPEPTVSVSPFALRANEIAEDEEEEPDSDVANGNGYTSPLIMQFFQMGNDDDGAAPSGDAAEPEDPGEDPEVVADSLWSQVEQELQEDAGDAYALSDVLREIACAIQLEMASCQLPMLDSTSADDFKPHTTHALRCLHLLPQVLDRVPQPVIWPTSNGIPQAAVGSHRLAAAKVASLLVSAGAVVLDEAVASTGIVPRLVHLCFAHPANNALHACILQLFTAALSSKISQLWRPLLEQGMGTGGVDSSGAGLAGALPPLQRQLAAVGIAAADMPQGQRLPLSGFVVAVAALLQAHLRDGLASGILQERLEGDEEWRDFTEEGGALQRLLREQDGGDLGGPRPRPPATLDGLACGGADGEAAALRNGSYMFNCHQLMGMLRHQLPPLSGAPRG